MINQQKQESSQVIKEGRIIGIISIKGGVGKTTTVSNLGGVLSHYYNKEVLVIDANFSAPTLGIHMGLINPQITLHNVMLNNKDIKDAIYKSAIGLHLLPSSIVKGQINPKLLKEKIKKIKSQYDLILIDSSPNLNDEMLATMIASDEIIVVTTPDYPTLSCTINAIKTAKQKKIPITGIIINKTRNKQFEITSEEIQQIAGVNILAVINDDVKIQESLSYTTPSAIFCPTSDTSVEYIKLAGALIGETFTDERWITKIKEIFNRQSTIQEKNREQYINQKKGF